MRNFGAMKKVQIVKMALFALVTLSACACSQRAEKAVANSATAKADIPDFSVDSAYSYIARQVAFGPRTGRSEAHDRCGAWLVNELKRHGADTVIEQRTDLDGFGPMMNIMGRFGTDKPNRILLLAHWDSRPTADAEPDSAKHSLAIDGANDGASGVGVLLEAARIIGQVSPDKGIDILFVDAEDAGNEGDEDSWARGASYFAENMPYGVTEPMPAYAVLLDMVGGANAVFPRELFSHLNARQLTDRIWALAAENNLGKRFPNRTGGAVTDDHLPLQRAGIPAVDIIETDNPATGSFNPTWHTLNDNLDNIDKQTLADVGQLVLLLIYSKQ